MKHDHRQLVCPPSAAVPESTMPTSVSMGLLVLIYIPIIAFVLLLSGLDPYGPHMQ